MGSNLGKIPQCNPQGESAPRHGTSSGMQGLGLEGKGNFKHFVMRSTKKYLEAQRIQSLPLPVLAPEKKLLGKCSLPKKNDHYETPMLKNGLATGPIGGLLKAQAYLIIKLPASSNTKINVKHKY